MNAKGRRVPREERRGVVGLCERIGPPIGLGVMRFWVPLRTKSGEVGFLSGKVGVVFFDFWVEGGSLSDHLWGGVWERGVMPVIASVDYSLSGL